MIALRRIGRRLAAPLLVLAATVAPSLGQDPQAPPAAGRVARDEVEARIARIEVSTELDSDLTARVLETLRRALAHLDERDRWNERASEIETEEREAASRIAAIREELARTREDPTVPDGLTLTEVEQGTANVRAELETTRLRTQELDAQAEALALRRGLLPELLAAAMGSLTELESQTSAELESDADEITLARGLELRANEDALTAEVRSHEQESGSIDIRRELLTTRRNKAARDAAFSERKVAAWQEAADELRRIETERTQREADQKVAEASEQHSALAVRAQEGADLASERSELALKIESLGAERAAAAGRLERLHASFDDTRRKLKAAGLTEAIGRLLRQKRRELSSRSTAPSRERKSEIARVQFRLIELENRRVELTDLETRVDEFLESIDDIVDLDRDAIQSSARELFSAEQELVRALFDDYQSYFGDLVSLDTTEQETRAVSGEFRHYVSEHVLWVRSSMPIWESPLDSFTQALFWFLDPGEWAAGTAALLEDLRTSPLAYIAGILILGLLFLFNTRLRRSLRASGERAARSTEQSMRATSQAIVATLLAALPLPALLAFISWRLTSGLEGPGLLNEMSEGLIHAALLLLLLQVTSLMVRSYGLGPRHFDWSEGSVSVVRRNLLWFTGLVVPLEAIVHTLSAHEALFQDESVSRVVFVVQMLAIATFLQRILHPRRGLLRHDRRRRGAWASGMRGLWYALGVFGPVALAVLAAVGFFFTARQLSSQIQLSAGFVVALLLAQGIALRWTLLVRRRMAIAQARARRMAELERDVDGALTERATATETIDAASLSQDVRQLTRTLIAITAVVGMWAIWVDVLPALGVFHDVELWSYSVQTGMEVTDAAGDRQVELVDQVVPVSLASMGLALLIAFATFIATRSLPSLLEIGLLRRLDLQQGERYAITTLLRYVLTIAGVVLAFDQLGVGWSKVQWLAAGISVGLGFGLQEIFANFVSGLTLLFERPIRVGDWVTVGGIEGSVSRIRIRATTIVDRELKELVVPNREFVTGQLINWTLSDPVTRVLLPVGIAYGSDVELTEKTLLQVGRACPYSLEDPSPNVVFRDFGASSLDFELRVFVTGRDIYPRVVHDLHVRVDRAFREAGIEIAFPQRDLHLRSAGPLEGLLATGKS